MAKIDTIKELEKLKVEFDKNSSANDLKTLLAETKNPSLIIVPSIEEDEDENDSDIIEDDNENIVEDEDEIVLDTEISVITEEEESGGSLYSGVNVDNEGFTTADGKRFVSVHVAAKHAYALAQIYLED